MDDSFIDTLMEAILKNRRQSDDNNKHNASNNVCDNDDATNEDSKVDTGESDAGE